MLTGVQPEKEPIDLSPDHLRRLRSLLEHGFVPLALPLFPGYLGMKKYDCAALLRPAKQGRLEIAAQPGYLVEGNISVKVEQGGEEWFVWKSHRVAATVERRDQLRHFEAELCSLLEA